MRAYLYSIFICVFCIGALSGCTSGSMEDGLPLPDLTYQGIQPIPLNTSEIRIFNAYEPNNEDTARSDRVLRTEEVLYRYAANRFRKAGNNGSLVMIIRDASVNKTYKESENAFIRAIGVDDGFHYTFTAVIDAVFSPYQNGRKVEARIRAERTAFVPDHYSLDEKDQEFFKLVEKTISDMDAEIQRSFINTFGIYKGPINRLPLSSPEMGSK